jgi:hypothetical protein
VVPQKAIMESKELDCFLWYWCKFFWEAKGPNSIPDSQTPVKKERRMNNVEPFKYFGDVCILDRKFVVVNVSPFLASCIWASPRSQFR